MSDVELPLNDALEVAVRQHHAGNTSAAREICQQVLAVDPRQADALHLFGVCLLEQGDPRSALQYVALALEVDASFAAAHRTLGTIYVALERPGEAARCFARLTALRPTDADAHSRLADVLTAELRFEEAEAARWRAIELDPHHSQSQLDLGDLHYLRGKVAQAIFVYSQIISLKPAFVPAYRARARVLAHHALWDEATEDLRKAVKLAPLDASCWTELAHTLSDQGDLVEAQTCCRRAIALEPGAAGPWNALGRVLETHGRFDAAAEAFDRVDKLDIRRRGTAGQAAPNRTYAPQQLTRLAAVACDADSPDEKILAEFALGRALDESDRFDKAFGVYRRANAAFKDLSSRRGFQFSASALGRTVDDVIDTFSTAFFREHAGWGHQSETPVFVVGMPRSGTTLVEQIAASHSEVFGAGERFDVARIRSRLNSAQGQSSPARWSKEAIAEESRAQLQLLERLGGSCRRVIDKMPENLLDLGLIATLFPGARVVVCQRDPRDTCLSCYFQKFARHQHLFSYDLQDCAAEFKQLKRLDEHWTRVLPLRMLFMEYEQMVADFQAQSRRLIEFLGLGWEPRCLEFYKTQRPVLTSSNWQVRQPIYARSVGRWKNYERHLGPLMAALGAAASSG